MPQRQSPTQNFLFWIFSLSSALLFTQPAKAEVRVQVQTDFTQHFNTSPPAETSTGDGKHLIARDLGLSTRWRAAIGLMERKGRTLELLIGPYLRWPLFFSLTGYGTDTQSPSSLEVGGDIGVSWFSFARTLLSFAPDWSLTYQAQDLGSVDPSRQVEVSVDHWSVGFRLEVPIWTLESEPGDRRVEFGGAVNYQLDRIRKYTVTPLNFTDDGTGTLPYNHPVSGTQEAGYRWMVGAFMNFRL